jgi:hypothetical protein
MRIHEILEHNELLLNSPLPDDWSTAEFNVPEHDKRIEYAAKRAIKIGSGDTRTAFDIDYQNRFTVLKVAHNAAGIVQNKKEINVLTDSKVQQIGITIPIIDYDTEHYQWIHMERADEGGAYIEEDMRCVDMSLLCELTGHILGKPVKLMFSNKQHSYDEIREIIIKDWESTEAFEICKSYAEKLALLVKWHNLSIGDFQNTSNWGLWNSKPVLIDLGLENR